MSKERQEDGSGSPKAAAPEQFGPPPAARRALAEAEARRKLAAQAPPRPKEIDGRDGPEPVRYGDWEGKGRACDF